MTDWEVVIGLEIHCQLSTETKLFCGCSTKFGDSVNSNICPVCTGQPGALPVMNKKAVEYAVKAGLALNCRVNPKNVFARKNYFYPDLPKGYQISQLDLPIVEDGWIEVTKGNGDVKKIGITRAHMEEDAGKLVHIGSERIHGSTGSMVNLNRACTPLIEIVSEPDMRTAEEARLFVEKVRDIVRFLGICDGNMEEGSLRCDANVSIMPRGSKEYGTKTEVKNMNSFKSIEAAIEAEIERQIDVVESGERIIQATMHYDENTGRTYMLRSKEEAMDYRYFPEPDLVPIVISKEWVDEIKSTMPQLPEQRKSRYIDDYGLSEYDAGVLLLDREISDFYDETVKLGADPKKVCNWVMGEISSYLNANDLSIAQSKVTPAYLHELLELIANETISGKIAKTVVEKVFETGNSPSKVVDAEGLKQVDNTDEIRAILEKLVSENPGPIQQLREGNNKVMGFFVGQVMKETQGKANPQSVNKIIKELL
jgi:aspartyl-tRNA(Asn)/glutamyl-tRNA(Gln) amidotransferase subunit B